MWVAEKSALTLVLSFDELKCVSYVFRYFFTSCLRSGSLLKQYKVRKSARKNIADFKVIALIVKSALVRLRSTTVATKNMVIEMKSGVCRIFNGYSLFPL